MPAKDNYQLFDYSAINKFKSPSITVYMIWKVIPLCTYQIFYVATAN